MACRSFFRSLVFCLFAVSTIYLSGAPGTNQKVAMGNDKDKTPIAPLSVEEFNELHDSLVPPDALWKSVPWQTSLIAAQNMAASEHKPIFIWSMDGHPLGCT